MGKKVQFNRNYDTKEKPGIKEETPETFLITYQVTVKLARAYSH